MRGRGCGYLGVLLLTFASCADGDGVLLLTVTASPPIPDVDRLKVTAVNGGMSASATYRKDGGGKIDLSSPQTMSLVFDKGRRGSVLITVEAQDVNGGRLATGTGTGTIQPSKTTELMVALTGGLPPGDMVVVADLTQQPTDLTGADLAGLDLVAVPDLITVADTMPPDLVIVPDMKTLGWTQKYGVATCRGVWGSSPDDVFAVGNGGTILHSTDRGQSWAPQTSGTGENLVAVWGTGKLDVYVTGNNGTILHSTNNGQTWQKQTSGVPSVYIRTVWGSGPNDVYAGADPGTATAKILHTTNQGATWTTSYDTGSPADSLHGIWGSSAGDIFVADIGGTLHSSNSGATWAASAAGTPGAPMFGVWGSGIANVYVVGGSGGIYRTINDGVSWSTEPSGTTRVLYGIWGASASNVLVVGSFGTILRSSGNSSWNAEVSGTTADCYGVWGSSLPNDVYVVGAVGILHYE